MGNDTLISAARAAGFAMAASEELLTPAARRAGEAPAPRTPDTPATEAPRQAEPKKAPAQAFFASLSWPTLPSFWRTA